MRINQYIANATGVSRREADKYIENNRVIVNSAVAKIGQQVAEDDEVYLDDKLLQTQKHQSVIINKPTGYVCSRDGQGSKTVYDLLPADLHNLKPVGRLDKDSSGLLLMTNDGKLANELTHPSKQKQKIYNVSLDKPLQPQDVIKIEAGVPLDDGLSSLKLEGEGIDWRVTMHEGRNRQIRRTFEALGYKIKKLHRIQFGDYKIDSLESGKFITT